MLDYSHVPFTFPTPTSFMNTIYELAFTMIFIQQTNQLSLSLTTFTSSTPMQMNELLFQISDSFRFLSFLVTLLEYFTSQLNVCLCVCVCARACALSFS
jgi:hypothetical protein